MKSQTVFIGLSGGVDSSVSAFLLQEAGYQVKAVFMKNWEADDTDAYCAAADDMADAQAVCDHLHIELERVNFADEYWNSVFTYFLNEYRALRTPNPDILCNREIKFKAFLHYAQQHGADYIATGHYAQIAQNDSDWLLQKGRDPLKDQSYFLYALNAEQLRHSLFPVGHLFKQEVRALAKKIGLPVHAKKDSTGICFIGERHFKQFLSTYLPAQPGSILTLEGEEMGKHDGLMFYTIGQRQGLRIGGSKGKAELPWYVVDKNIEKNALIVVQGEHPALYQNTIFTRDIHWIASPPSFPCNLSAKIRYRQTDQPCVVHAAADGQYRIVFQEAQRAVAPGQSIVFYDNEFCLGGGIIHAFPSSL